MCILFAIAGLLFLSLGSCVASPAVSTFASSSPEATSAQTPPKPPSAPKRIAVFALPYFSHANMLTEMALELRRRGHAVSVVFSAGFREAPDAKLHAAGADVLRYRVPYERYELTDPAFLQRLFVGYTRDEVHGASEFGVDAGDEDLRECRYLLADRELFARLRAARFDLVLLDGLCFYRCLALVPLLLGGLPFATSITIVEPWLLGAPALPSHFPTPFSELAAGTIRVDSFAMRRLLNIFEIYEKFYEEDFFYHLFFICFLLYTSYHFL